MSSICGYNETHILMLVIQHVYITLLLKNIWSIKKFTFAFHQKLVGSSDRPCPYCWQHLGKTESADFTVATQTDGN